jgi:hypothetical protein
MNGIQTKARLSGGGLRYRLRDRPDLTALPTLGPAS